MIWAAELKLIVALATEWISDWNVGVREAWVIGKGGSINKQTKEMMGKQMKLVVSGQVGHNGLGQR